MNKLIFENTLYSRAKNGQLLQWTIEVYQTNETPKHGQMIIYSGYYNGRLKQYTHPYTEGKNVGRSNETDGLGQALEEAKSKINKQVNKGYRDLTIKEAEEQLDAIKRDKNDHEKPMLAKKYRIGIDNNYPKIVQRKYNGVRAELGFKKVDNGLFGEDYEVYLLSREGKYYVVPDKMKKELENIAWNYPEIVDIKFDGEVYNHNMLLQEINSSIKKRNSQSDNLYYVCYDIKDDNIQSTRLKYLERLQHRCFKYASTFKMANSMTIHYEEVALELADDYIEEGYEGAILRHPEGKYVTTRSSNLLKIKKTYKNNYKVVDIIETERDNYKGLPIGLYICINKHTGKTFKVTPKASKKDRYDLLLNRNEHINKEIEVEYREVSKDKVPMHATAKIINN